MARLASQAKMEYYPTPPAVVQHVKSALSLQGPGSFRFLDTCCGAGEALSLLAAGLPEVETYGVELDEARYRQALHRLHHAVWGDALTELRISSRGFSLLWLNPPYDGDGDGGRLEARFLWHLDYLVPNGWLVFIIPHRALSGCAATLAKLKHLQMYAFPQDDFEVFKQLVILGQKSPLAPKEAHAALLNEIAGLSPAAAWDRLPKTSDLSAGSVAVPPSPPGRIVFAAARSDLATAQVLVAQSLLWKQLAVLTTPRTLDNLHPLAPLRQGHLAMLLAGGLMNGEVEANGKRLVIKGAVHKRVEVTTETTDGYRIETRADRYQVVIKAIDLNKKEIFTIS